MAENLANSFINKIQRPCRLPGYMTLHSFPQLTTKFLKQLYKQLNVNLGLSTAYHPQTDKLCKHEVQKHQQYISIYCYKRQNQWLVWLPLLAFAYYIKATTTHKLYQYRSIYSLDPHTNNVNNRYQLSTSCSEE